MIGAFTLDLIKQRHEIAVAHAWGIIGIGFVVSSWSAWPWVKGFIGFVGRYGLGPFVWWRVLVARPA